MHTASMTQLDRNLQFCACSTELRIGQNCNDLESLGIALALHVADGRWLARRLAPSKRCFGLRRDSVSTATTLYSLVERKNKERQAEADSQVGCLTQIMKEQHTNPRHGSSQSTLKAMHQSHIPMMRRGVTFFGVVRENGK